MLFTSSCLNCRNEKGLLNFVSKRIKLVYRINNTQYKFQKNKLPLKHRKPRDDLYAIYFQIKVHI